MPKYAQLEVDLVRAISKQPTSDETSGTQAVTRSLILYFMAEADAKIQSLLLGSDPNITLFNESLVVSTVSGQSEYSLPVNIYAGDELKAVHYSRTGQEKDYVPLARTFLSQKDWGQTSYVDSYFTQGNKLVVSPTPNTGSGTLKLYYTKMLPRIDIRKGVIGEAPTVVGDYYTTIVLADDSTLNEDGLSTESHISICDRNGVIKRMNVEYSSYSSGSKTITLTSPGEPTDASDGIGGGEIEEGDYVVLGKYASSHSALPDICDDYRIEYAALRVMMVTSNTDATMQAVLVDECLNRILQKLKSNWHGIVRTPISGFYA